MTELRDDSSAGSALPGSREPLWEAIQNEVRKLKMMETVIGTPTITLPTIHRFQLCEQIGSGGMGAVFKAYDPQLRRFVALKVCKFQDDESAGAIEHEARCLAQVAHPNVVAAYEVVRTETDVLLVMEFVQGQTLRAWQRETHPSWDKVLANYLDAGNGLAAVHAAGLEHGDFKPDNVLVGDDGRVRVVDFGIARYLAGPVDDDFEVKALGTTAYMAPERLAGMPSDARADVFSYCVSVWESLYGTRPYEGTTPSKLLDSMEAGTLATDPERELSGTPEAIRPILASGISPRLQDRPPSMVPLLRALTDIPELEHRRVTRRRRVSLASAMLGMLAVIMYQAAAPREVQVEHEPEAVVEAASIEPLELDLEPSIDRAMSLAALADPLGAWSEYLRVDERATVKIDTTLRLACILIDRARSLPSDRRETTLRVADQVANTALLAAESDGTPAEARAAKSLTEMISHLR